MLQQQAETDTTWRAASDGVMRMDKITYRSKAGDLDIPAFVFQPLRQRGAKGHPAIVWVHENIRGHLYEHYIPYIREATSKGYVVIAPEYRGQHRLRQGLLRRDRLRRRRSRRRRDGGGRVEDEVSAGRSRAHRHHRLEPRRDDHAALDLQERDDVQGGGGDGAGHESVSAPRVEGRRAAASGDRSREPLRRAAGRQKHDIYKDRSPLYSVDKLQIPLLVHVTKNDEDVNIEEDMQLVDALRSRKPFLAETKVYDNPPGGHTFDRRVDPKTLQPENTREQRDSWNRVWTFLDWNLDPFHDASGAVPATLQR